MKEKQLTIRCCGSAEPVAVLLVAACLKSFAPESKVSIEGETLSTNLGYKLRKALSESLLSVNNIEFRTMIQSDFHADFIIRVKATERNITENQADNPHLIELYLPLSGYLLSGEITTDGTRRAVAEVKNATFKIFRDYIKGVKTKVKV